LQIDQPERGARQAPPSFIAEVSSNHAQDLDRSLTFVDAAAEAGCTGVKFQLFRVEELFAPEALAARPELLARKSWELPLEFLEPLAARSRERGLDFLCTPFYLEAVEQLLPFVTAYKIASYELLWPDLLTRCAATGKPVVLSTGMASMDEISTAVDVLRAADCVDLTVLHCVSGYPAPRAECNLAAIEALREAFDCPVGWSDHSVDPSVIDRAVHRWGAEMIEFHLDLEGTGAEYASGHCWLPHQIASTIERISRGLEADGDGKKTPAPIELSDREWRADPVDGLRPLSHVRAGLERE
jgi:N-acetylneuraminate synthase